MLIWQWGLIASSALLFVILVFMLTRYFSLRKVARDVGVINKESDKKKELEENASAEEKMQWLSLLEQQKNLCVQMLGELSKADVQGKAALSCWSIFLDIEMHILKQDIPMDDIPELLEAFKELLDRVDRAQEVDALLKAIKVNQSLLKELSKVIQKAGDKVFAQVDITSELNLRLDKLQGQLMQETDLDDSLALLRAEIASMYEFIERLKLRLDEVKQEGEDAVYIDALETFLSDTGQSEFLHSVRSELDDKVSDLKQLAAYQKAIIVDLKEQARKSKHGYEGDGKHIGVYDISIVRLEKALLESDRVVKRLEGKLESLQTIKYNLNIDVMKRDEALKQKKALLDQQEGNSSQSVDIYNVFDEERNTMQNMEDLLHRDSYTEESDNFANEQASKLSSLRTMVNESELYVEMLEHDLEKARVLRESLELKLKNPELLMNSVDEEELNSQLEQDLREVENLKEINEELMDEKKRLQAELFDGQSQTEEFNKLKKKIDELDVKIESVQKNYVEMEERYLAALMAQDDNN
ncbi:hypothetical protein C0J08_04480 [Marinomonas sp. CT5]|uniref:hypothetical protein n=1 Tax=Marinomonas sp. CT5 TaxID=2066133 RepID=UPI001BAF4041|nr:hypothetical protein [Marinomonas sp. CT5]QUX94710.1 hypothetical protein C0J08_04480 [Marinomonas sp. CT5]